MNTVEDATAELWTLAECLGAMAAANLADGRPICGVTLQRLAAKLEAAASRLAELAQPAGLAAA